MQARAVILGDLVHRDRGTIERHEQCFLDDPRAGGRSQGEHEVDCGDHVVLEVSPDGSMHLIRMPSNRDLVLVPPDQHVAWRSDDLPEPTEWRASSTQITGTNSL